jgi:hypothetical protein
MDEDGYDLRITYRIKIKKWRIDDQNNIENREWSLYVYDRNKEEWLATTKLNRPGEEAYIESIETL